MESIVLKKIERTGKGFRYDFSVSEGLKEFFSGKPFEVEYSENVDSVPDGVAAVPFVGCVLPILWLTDAELALDRLDRDFYDCIPRVRQGYEKMYPGVRFGGRLKAEHLEQTEKNTGGAGILFSGGLDAVSSLITHLPEKPMLLSVWGADIACDSVEGWERVYRGIAEYAENYRLESCVIRSAFREFDRETVLTDRFRGQLQDAWWHGIKHALGLLTHMAPCAWLHGLEKIYIASSFTRDDEPVRCASSPFTDNYVRFAGTEVIHDGYEFNRQDKIRNVVRYVNATHNPAALHVCWMSQSGGNCCRCEKCCRTMTGLIAEGADPADYGFDDIHKEIRGMHNLLAWEGGRHQITPARWSCIRRRMLENHGLVRKSPYWQYVKFVEKMDFSRENPVSVPILYRIRGVLGELRWYQALHRVKLRLLHREEDNG